MTTIFERRGNPARNLFRLWDTIIEANGGQAASYGSAYNHRGGTIHRLSQNPDMISYANLWLDRDGRFRLSSMHGGKQRKWTADGTFLGWRWWRGQYHWFVDFATPTYWGQSLWSIEDYELPVPYASETAMGTKYNWGSNALWMELEPYQPAAVGAPKWRIVPARMQGDKSDPWGKMRRINKAEKAQWTKHERLVAWRYERLRREALGIPTAPSRVSVRTPSVVSNGTKFEGAEAVHKIAALLNVHQPAKLSKRLEEAHS